MTVSGVPSTSTRCAPPFHFSSWFDVVEQRFQTSSLRRVTVEPVSRRKLTCSSFTSVGDHVTCCKLRRGRSNNKVRVFSLCEWLSSHKVTWLGSGWALSSTLQEWLTSCEVAHFPATAVYSNPLQYAQVYYIASKLLGLQILPWLWPLSGIRILNFFQLDLQLLRSIQQLLHHLCSWIITGINNQWPISFVNYWKL